MRKGVKPLYLAEARGFCAGVQRAVAMAEEALTGHALPVYGLNEIVHNRTVVERLSGLGLRFVRDIAAVPVGATVLFSAHGVSPAVRETARIRGLRVIDATCPFVLKVHGEVRRYARAGYTVFLVGARSHDEVVGTAGEAPDRVVVVQDAVEARTVQATDPSRVAAVSQTTLSLEAAEEVLAVLRHRFPGLAAPDTSDICHATSDRQNAVRELVRHTEHILVLGSANSSNSLRLVETARRSGASGCLIDREEALAALDFDGMPSVGLTAGASTPESFIVRIVERLRGRGFAVVAKPGKGPGAEQKTVADDASP